MGVFIILSAVAWTSIARVSGLQCPLQETGWAAADSLSICAMCSESHAAVRWNVTDDGNFEFVWLRYICRHPNNSIAYELDFNAPEDTCFTRHVRHDNSLTGATAVGYELWTGVNCEFRVKYRVYSETPPVKVVNCTVRSPQVCEANPEECHTDIVRVMNENGECPEYQCAEGYSGELCNNIDECLTISCGENATCHDTDGGYWCKCWSGFQGDGYNCTDINECETLNETCSDENAECVNTVGNYSCQCKPGYTGDGYNCTDINECTEGEFSCPNSTVCINHLGTYHCDTKDLTDSRTKVVSGVVFGVLLLILLLVLTATLIIGHRYFKRKKVLPFHELTKTDLDPTYSPTFWTYSMSSIHSTYERLGLYESTTNTDQRSICHMGTLSQSSSSSSMGGLSEGESHAHRHTGNPLIAGEQRDESFSHPPYIPGTRKSIIEGAALSLPPDIQASPHKDDTLPKNIISARNYMFDIEIPGILLNSQEYSLQQEPTTSVGYVQDCHQITGSGSDTLKDCIGVGTEKDTGYVTEDATTCSSGYSTEATSYKGQDSHCTAEAYGSESLEKESYNRSVAASVSSSGYATESVAEELCSHTDTSYNDGLQAWQSQSSLRSDGTDRTIDLKGADLDSAKLTFNARREFEYINAVEEDFCINVSFKIPRSQITTTT